MTTKKEFIESLLEKRVRVFMSNGVKLEGLLAWIDLEDDAIGVTTLSETNSTQMLNTKNLATIQEITYG